MKYIPYLLLLLAIPSLAAASLELDAITYDPVIIASGDEVEIIVQFHHEVVPTTQERINDPDYTYQVELEPDDALTTEHVRILDGVGDDVRGAILTGEYYNKRFRVKVANDAPAGNYEFLLAGQWYYRGEPTVDRQFIRFRMPVKKEGIVLDIADYDTLPGDVRPGDEYVEVQAFIQNTGGKGAEAVEATLSLPDGFSASYTNNNRAWLGIIPAGEQRSLTAYVDVDEDVAPGVYELTYMIRYQDDDRREYVTTENVPFLLRKSPHLVITESDGLARAGGDGVLTFGVENTGTEAAESIDVRLLKESSQPFTLDVRSHYLGSLEPGESRDVEFRLGVLRDARQGEHDFTVVIRAKGDSDEGDDNTYVFTRRAQLVVDGDAPNLLLWIGLGLLVVVLVVFFATRKPRRRKR